METNSGSDEAALEYSWMYNPPMDLTVAERNLKEVKQVLDQLNVVFLLESGSCLGAVRDNAFIPWDDDIDLISVIGLNGLTEETVDAAVAALRDRGYFVREMDGAYSKARITMKNHVRVSLDFVQIIDGNVTVFPGIPLPGRLFTQPKEIEFLGERFLVPNPPEEYLRLKYGSEWMVSKKAGAYEIDVVEKIPSENLGGRSSRIKVLDDEGMPVSDAEVVLVGGGRSRTDGSGYAEIILPGADWYALIIRYQGHEQVLYMEKLEPDRSYVYRADSVSKAVDHSSGAVGTLGNLLSPE
ncbi:LicD family protein [Chloroflexota bacterium]